MIVEATVVFLALLFIGYFLSAYLYHQKGKPFVGSMLQVKILMWLPIYLVFLLYVYGSRYFQMAVVIALIAVMLFEMLRIKMRQELRVVSSVHVLLMSAGMFASYQIVLQQADYQQILLTIAFASVLSDVTAFFFGNFFGSHHLPKVLNDRKSWEGVLGQIIGAFLGVILLNAFVLPSSASLFIALPIGIGAVIGDLFNSYIKRRVGIKDWSGYLPGHGGYIDRLSSLSMSILLVYVFAL